MFKIPIGNIFTAKVEGQVFVATSVVSGLSMLYAVYAMFAVSLLQVIGFYPSVVVTGFIAIILVFFTDFLIYRTGVTTGVNILRLILEPKQFSFLLLFQCLFHLLLLVAAFALNFYFTANTATFADFIADNSSAQIAISDPSKVAADVAAVFKSDEAAAAALPTRGSLGQKMQDLATAGNGWAAKKIDAINEKVAARQAAVTATISGNKSKAVNEALSIVNKANAANIEAAKSRQAKSFDKLLTYKNIAHNLAWITSILQICAIISLSAKAFAAGVHNKAEFKATLSVSELFKYGNEKTALNFGFVFDFFKWLKNGEQSEIIESVTNDPSGEQTKATENPPKATESLPKASDHQRGKKADDFASSAHIYSYYNGVTKKMQDRKYRFKDAYEVAQINGDMARGSAILEQIAFCDEAILLNKNRQTT